MVSVNSQATCPQRTLCLDTLVCTALTVVMVGTVSYLRYSEPSLLLQPAL